MPVRLEAFAVSEKLLVTVPDSPVPQNADVRSHVNGQEYVHFNVPVPALQLLLLSLGPDLFRKDSLATV